jgi:hypothetical protein
LQAHPSPRSAAAAHAPARHRARAALDGIAVAAQGAARGCRGIAYSPETDTFLSS